MNKPWQDLRVGDQVRMVRMPDWSSAPGNPALDETIALYRILVAERAILTIDNIDEFGKPWTAYFYVVEKSNGGGCQILPTGDADPGNDTGYHTLALDDDSWERVENG